MPRQVACSCRRVLQIPDTLRAERVQCPGCGNSIPLPTTVSSSIATSPLPPPRTTPLSSKPVPKVARGVAPPPRMPERKRRSWAIPILLACLALPLLIGVPLLVASLGDSRPEPTVAVLPEDMDEDDDPVPGRNVFGAVGKARTGGRGGASGRFNQASDIGEMPLPSVIGTDPLVKPRVQTAKPNVQEEDDLALLRDRVKEQERTAEERARRLEELRALKKARGLEMQLKQAELDALSKELPSDVLRAAQKRIENERQKVAAERSAAELARQKEFEALRALNRAKADALIQDGVQRMKAREFRQAADSFAAAKMLVPYDEDVELLFREARRMEDREAKFDDAGRADRAMKLVKAAKASKPAWDEEQDRTRAAGQAWLAGLDEQDERSAVIGRTITQGLRDGSDRAAKAGAAQNAGLRAMGERANAAGQAQMGALRAQGARAAGAMRAAREALVAEGMRAGWANRAQMVGLREQGDRMRAAGQGQNDAMRAQDQRYAAWAKQQTALLREQGQRSAGAALQQAANLRAQGDRIAVAGEQQNSALRAGTERAAGAGRAATEAMIAQGERSAIMGRTAIESLRDGSDRASAAGREAVAGLNAGSERAGRAGQAATENLQGQGDRMGGGTIGFDEQAERSRRAGREAAEALKERPPIPVSGGQRPAASEDRQAVSAAAQEMLDKLRQAEQQAKQERDAARLREEHERELAALKAKKTAADKEEDELKRLEAEMAQAADAELRIKAIRAELELRGKTGGATTNR